MLDKLDIERAQRSVLKVMFKRPFRYPTAALYAQAQVLTVVQCTLHLLVLTRCSLVFDVHNQEAQKNIYCTANGSEGCLPGTHVLCMYNQSVLGPRCDQGQIVNLQYLEREFIRHIYNGFKRAIVRGDEILGKNDVPLPRGIHLRAFHWDHRLADAAQAWANQCNPLQSDFCHNFGLNFPQAGQLIHIMRFGYPDWSYPGKNFIDNLPFLTIERIRFVIAETAKEIYASRKEVTVDLIKNYTRGLKNNAYIQVILGNARRIGCGMTQFVDYVVGNKEDPYTYNAVLFVCNFSNKPMEGLPLYKVVSESTPETELEQPCYGFDLFQRNDDGLCSLKTDPVDKGYMPSEECDAILEKEGRGKRPAVVLMPIFAVEDADPNQQLKKETTSPAIERKRQALRKKIKGHVEKVRDRYFKNYVVINPGARLPDGGPVDADTFALSRFKPGITKKSKVVGRRGEDLQITTKRQRHTVKSRKDFSNMEQLVSEYLSRKHKLKSLSTANVQSLEDMRQFITATVTPDLEHFKGLSTRESRYGVRGSPEREQIDFENRMTDTNKMVQYKIRNTGRDIPGIYNNLLRPVKNIRRGESMYNIRPSFEYEQPSITQRNNFLSRNLSPLHSHYGRHNPGYNRGFENDRYVNFDHDKPPVMNSDYDGRQIRNGDAYLDVHFNRDNRRPNQPYVYGTNKISNFNGDRSNYRRPLKNHDDKSRQFDRRQRDESMDARLERHYLVPDRFNHMLE